MKRLLVLLTITVLLIAGCYANDDPGSVPAHRTTDELRFETITNTDTGATYNCIVFDKKSGYAGMGGLWCERQNETQDG